MIQDIFPARLDNHYTAAELTRDSRIMLLRKGQILARRDEDAGAVAFPLASEFADADGAVYLFTMADEPYFLLPDRADLPEGCAFFSLQDLRAMKLTPRAPLFAAYTAFHLWKWYETSRYCGACGGRTEHDAVERAMVCRACGNRIYPRINPAVIIGVTNGDRLLLTRYQRGYGHNALVAGFTEIGETLEETVGREVMEEVGLSVKNIRYYKSQPWGVASDILAGFYCDVDGSDEIRRDDSELKYAQWVPRDEIELQPTDDSLTNEMMRRFKEGKVC